MSNNGVGTIKVEWERKVHDSSCVSFVLRANGVALGYVEEVPNLRLWLAFNAVPTCIGSYNICADAQRSVEILYNVNFHESAN